MLTFSCLMVSGAPMTATSGFTKPMPMPQPSMGEKTPLVTVPTASPSKQIS